MIAANKRFLKANLTQGVLSIQTNLINLYSNNLSAVATQAALIAGLAFAVTATSNISGSNASLALGYFYYACFTTCLVSSLFILSQATIAGMFGPTMALKGNSDEAVKYAASKMLDQQYLIIKTAFVAITSLFLGALILCWNNYPYGIAAINTCIYIVSYYLLVTHGYEAYITFVPNEGESFVELDNNTAAASHQGGTGASNSSGTYRPTSLSQQDKDETSNDYPYPITASGGTDDYHSPSINGVNPTSSANIKLMKAQEASHTKLRAELWKRQAMEEGGMFVKYFAVLEKGRLDFYAKETDFRENLNPVNKKSIKLWQYDISTDPKSYTKNIGTFGSVLKSFAIGNEDFSTSDLLTSPHDLQKASRDFKFGLMPKVSSELQASVTYEFLAHDDRLFKLWVSTLTKVTNGYNEIAAAPSVENTMRIGTSDVEIVVQSANVVN